MRDVPHYVSDSSLVLLEWQALASDEETCLQNHWSSVARQLETASQKALNLGRVGQIHCLISGQGFSLKTILENLLKSWQYHSTLSHW